MEVVVVDDDGCWLLVGGWWLDGQIVHIKVGKTNDTSHGHSNATSGGNSEVKVMATDWTSDVQSHGTVVANDMVKVRVKVRFTMLVKVLIDGTVEVMDKSW